MKLKKFTDFSQLDPHYSALFLRAQDDSFFYSLPWFKNFAAHALDSSDRIAIYAVEPENGAGTPIAVLPMLCRSDQGWLRYRELDALANYYTSLFGPIIGASGACLAQAIRKMAAAICSEVPRWDLVRLSPLDPSSPGFEELLTGLRQAGMVVQTFFCFGNWYLQAGGRSYEQYFRALPSVLQNTIGNKSKKLKNSGGRIEIIAGTEGLEPAIQAYEKVYRASWKIPEPYPEFIRGLVRTCAELGWLRLGIVYVNEVPAAAQIWVVSGRTASIYKLAYDEQYSHLSVGTILTSRLMEHVMDVDKVQVVDYLTGDDSYKKDWMSHRRERWGIVAFNPRTPRGMLGIVRHVAGRSLKRGLEKLLGKSPDARTAPTVNSVAASGRTEIRGQDSGHRV